MKSLAIASCVCFFILLAAKIDGRATTSSQALATSERHHKVPKIHSNIHRTADDEQHFADNHAEELAIVQGETGKAIENSEGTTYQMVEQSTAIPVEKPLTINWKSMMAILIEVALKLFEFVSNNFKRLHQRLLHIIIPLFSTLSGPQSSGHPAIATSNSIDWRSAGTALFKTLIQFQSLRGNEVW